MNLFDRKFGKDFLAQVPLAPGIYVFRNAEGAAIYVGKAKLLRRRLGQYRNAKRRKKHRKMKTILSSAESLEFTPCESETAALLKENELIQSLRPRFNIAGAFSFMYPVIGMRYSGTDLLLVYTTEPEPWSAENFELFGAYRSRQITREAFYSALDLLSWIGHREPDRKIAARFPEARYSKAAGFRQIPEEVPGLLRDFLRGSGNEFPAWLAGRLLEKAGARKNASEVQEQLRALARFFRFESRSLFRARGRSEHGRDFVSQTARDRIFILSRSEYAPGP